jgi:lysyl-tRNA synthetase, class II
MTTHQKKMMEEEVTQEHLSSLEHQQRVEKVQELRKQGIEPWPASKEVTATCVQAREAYETSKDGTSEYALAGRIMLLRQHGKTIFAHIQDRSGRLQIYVRKDEVSSEEFELLNHLVDVGDIVWVCGTMFTTKLGEVTLHVKSFSLLSKCLHPLPEKFHGLADVEKKYRQRYLDLICNPETRERFRRRSAIIHEMREFLTRYDFMEVETPMLHPIPGGAAARPFSTHHNALDSDFFLRIAPELYLKRLVVGGFERVFEINRNFRNEGISTRHNPEFTMLEFYMAYKDYHYAMDLVEQMLRHIASNVCGSLQVPFGDHLLDFSKPFERLSMHQAIMQWGKYTAADLEGDALDKVLKKHAITFEESTPSWGKKIAALFEEVAEKHLIQPTFIVDFPLDISPLAKRDEHNPQLAARFELYIGAMELSNGFNELNDPFDQAVRFKQQAQAHEAGDSEAHFYDADYIEALEYGLPPTVGVGIGIDRLVMVLTNTTSIKEVILFPTLKKKKS